MTPARPANAQPKVRFAPSPTGKMHLGSARTALFNWLQAQHTGGEFLLRIEDTDTARSTPENTAYIFEAMAWLGLSPSQPPLIQSSRLAEHTKIAHQLVANGQAYVDAEGVTRFKIPSGASTTWTDINGPITIQHTEIEDFALLRSNGSPTYHLSVVADDIFQGITHVIRGDDHIANTPKQILLYQALNAPVPQFSHLPLILNAAGEKLSKRHGAASVQDLQAAGYLPHAVFNFLLRLGWGHGNQEVFSVTEAIQLFDISHVSPAAARYDAAKLNWLNAQYLKSLPFEQIEPHLLSFLPEGTQTHPTDLARLRAMWPHLAQRANTLPEAVQAGHYLLADVTADYTPEHTAILLAGHHPLHDFYDAFSRVATWEHNAIDTAFHAVMAATNPDAKLAFQQAGKPLRVALTNLAGGPPLPAIMAALGQNEVLRRLKVSLHHIHQNGGHH